MDAKKERILKSLFECPNDGETLQLKESDTQPKPGQVFIQEMFCPKCGYEKRVKGII